MVEKEIPRYSDPIAGQRAAQREIQIVEMESAECRFVEANALCYRGLRGNKETVKHLCLDGGFHGAIRIENIERVLTGTVMLNDLTVNVGMPSRKP